MTLKTWVVGLAVTLFGVVMASGNTMAQVIYSESEMHMFWQFHLEKIVMEEIVGGKYPIPAINDRYRALLNKIIARDKKPFGIQASILYDEYSNSVVSGVSIDHTTIVIFVPAIMDVYKGLQSAKSVDWEKQFEATIVISILHEVDHFAGKNSESYGESRKDLIKEESRAWAETCEHTISVFINAGYPLDPSSTLFYKNWVSCGKRNNKNWKSFIATCYSEVSQHYK